MPSVRRQPSAPLARRDYTPLHPPVDGKVPDVVAKWGPRSQIRWFDRFRDQIAPMPGQEWARFYCSSVQHTGQCCSSCQDDARDGYRDWDLPSDWLNPQGDERCCCYALHAADDAAVTPGV